MSIIARFKRDISKHRGRAAVLGVLFVTMVVFGVKAFFELNRPVVVAAVVTNPKTAAQPRPVLNSTESEARVNESKKLWRTLREVTPSAASTAVAFAFDPSLYPPPLVDPTRRVTVAPPPEAEPTRVTVITPAVDLEAMKADHVKRIREQSRQLVVKTTAIGNASTPPMAIINQQLLVVGQEIHGFTLSAIRPREVEFVKEGVTVVVKMAEGQ